MGVKGTLPYLIVERRIGLELYEEGAGFSLNF